jgi:hypothetical protein
MIRKLLTGIAALALMTGPAFAQDSYSSTTTVTRTYDDGPYYRTDYRDGSYYYDRGYYRDHYDYGHDPATRAVGGGATGAALGAAIGCVVTIPIGCAPGAAVGAAVGGGTGAVAGAASTPRRDYYPAPEDYGPDEY